MKSRQNEQGLTLIEVMLVVIILGILVALVVPQFSGRTEQARRAAAAADINANLATALEMYQLDNGVYPTTEQGLAALLRAPEIPPLPPSWQGPYLKKSGALNDPWGQPYIYRCPGEHNSGSYDLSSTGPDRQSGGGDDVNNWDQDDSGNRQ
ncbi:MAG: type II secretion system major pseudopilin GspG [candidate division KSB1 bacterium]|nr:type II secretion system major pseudopilin GspG [candidate division KSB1 bacterium]MDZ7300443.1 type II secretion system major pseudopilin GspG [candidate division KSB1 bacterium]MDZ7308722.1 type II secretion system major pseudopilin GspG [candidate division KSB1 bacterium]MDZ7351455.1 type II secretion system major pseudopilin GspG [candidate division KSB1 bacterium]MDZ7355814.1 type II secretion system major pseudopilin GspG [candidate division KSB1 bacterium]